MIEHIISDLNRQFHRMLPEVKQTMPQLEDFTIIPGSAFGLDPNVNTELRDEIERAKYYIVLRFSPQGNRQMAVRAFKTMMEDKLGLPSTNDVEDEVMPPSDYEYAQPNSRYDDDDVIDIGDDGNVSTAPVQYRGMNVDAPRKKYYAVEFRVEAPRGLPGPNGRTPLGSRQSWNPHHQLGGGRRNARMIGY